MRDKWRSLRWDGSLLAESSRHFRRILCVCPHASGARIDPNREVRSDAPWPSKYESAVCGDPMGAGLSTSSIFCFVCSDFWKWVSTQPGSAGRRTLTVSVLQECQKNAADECRDFFVHSSRGTAICETPCVAAACKLRSLTLTARRSTSRVQLANSGRRKSAPFIALNHTIDPSLPPSTPGNIAWLPRRTYRAVRTRVARRERRQRRELITRACHVSVMAHLISCFFLQAEDEETKEPSIELVTGTVEPTEQRPENFVGHVVKIQEIPANIWKYRPFVVTRTLEGAAPAHGW